MPIIWPAPEIFRIDKHERYNYVTSADKLNEMRLRSLV